MDHPGLNVKDYPPRCGQATGSVTAQFCKEVEWKFDWPADTPLDGTSGLPTYDNHTATRERLRSLPPASGSG